MVFRTGNEVPCLMTLKSAQISEGLGFKEALRGKYFLKFLLQEKNIHSNGTCENLFKATFIIGKLSLTKDI